MNKICATLSTPINEELGSITGTVDQIKGTIINWLETAADGDTISIKSADEDFPENVIPLRPGYGTQQWAESQSDDIPSYDEPGDRIDDFDY